MAKGGRCSRQQNIEVCTMQRAQISLNAIYQRTLESRMMQKCQVRFGRGSMEKYPDEGQLANGLPYGREVVTTGDGMLAAFQAPTKAIQCATAIRTAVRTLGLEIRAGLHTGEYKLIGDEVVGIAIHIGARVAAKAGANEILVSSRVRDLVSESGIMFKDRGLHKLKGVPNRWRLYLLDS